MKDIEQFGATGASFPLQETFAFIYLSTLKLRV